MDARPDAPDEQDGSQDFIVVGFVAIVGGIAGLILGALVGSVASWLFVSAEAWGSQPPTIIGIIGGALLGVAIALVRTTSDRDVRTY
jgi:uncharacterized protein involved in exopolysaccharide biosynthesis